MNRYIILAITLLLFSWTPALQSQSQSQTTLLQEASQAYSQKNYTKAITLYETLLGQTKNADLYYNLANACFKSNQMGPAILNYERALLLNPSDEDTRFNLELAKTKITDKIEPIRPFFVLAWHKAIMYSCTSNTWSMIAIVSFILFLSALACYFFARNRIARKMGFYSALFLLLFTFLFNQYAFSIEEELNAKNTAIVLSSTVTAKSSPDKSGTDLFVLHEGTKITIKNRVGQWAEIVLEDGNVGWLPLESFEVI